MEMPEEIVLIARGRYSTLSRERRKQLERFQKTATTAMTNIAAALKDAQSIPPVSLDAISTVEKCLHNLMATREALVELCGEMDLLRPMAWPHDPQ